MRQEIQRLPRSVRTLKLAVAALCAAAGVAGLAAFRQATPAGAPPQVLRVSELQVVDARGVVRVRVSGSLPDAVIRGRLTRRGDVAAGVKLYDTTGQERGGYVTLDRTGAVGLTLDTRDGQTAVFRADSIGSTVLRVWAGRDLAELRADGARYTVVKGGAVTLQQPALPDPRDARMRRPPGGTAQPPGRRG